MASMVISTGATMRSSMTPQAACNRDDIQNGERRDYSCIPFIDIPRHKYSLSVNYELPLAASIGIVQTALTHAWIDDIYVAPIAIHAEEPGAWLDSFNLVNASISWQEIYGSQFDLQVFGADLTDEEYRISSSNAWTELGYKHSIRGESRMSGLRLSYLWGEV